LHQKLPTAWFTHLNQTTLAALAVRRLQNAFQSTAVRVASIFIQEDVSTNRGAFIEDLLCSIHRQLAIYAVDVDHESVNCYSKYEKACHDGKRSAIRINLLQRALCSRPAASDFSFLVLDGYDRLDEELQWLVDRELADLQSQGLRVMTTRRVPVFEDFVDADCDHCPATYLEFYWECQNRKAEGYSCILCYDCRNNWVPCENDEDIISFKEPYSHMSSHIGQIPNEYMEKFILWDMWREHEDVGFAVQETGVPPLSPEENPPRTPSTDATLGKIISFVSKYAHSNITIAKIRLEEIHNGRSSEDLDNVRDRLPHSLVALFDAGIQRIERQPKAQRDLALLAIAAAAEKDTGVSLTSLEECIRDAMSRSPHVVNAPPHSLEDILRAANGFLAMQRCDSKDVAIFNPAFLLYVKENYNDSLYWARRQLGLNDMSGLLSQDGSGLTSPLPITASPPSVGTSFDILSDGTIDETREPLDSSSSHWRGSGGKWTDSDGMATTPGQLSVSDMSITDSTARMGSGDYIIVSPNRSYPRKTDLKPGERDARKEFIPIICFFCKETVFQSRKSSGAHQNSLEALRSSASEHCVFCISLNNEIAKFSSEHSTVTKWPLYRWALRSTGKTRESKGSMVVTFRPRSHDKLPEHHLLGQRKALSLRVEKEDNHPSYSLSREPQLASRSFFMFPEQDFVHLPNEEELGWSTDLVTGGDQIREWIRNCDSNHGGCPKHIDGYFLPTRLIDLDIGQNDMVRIVDTTRRKIRGPYVTLSHSWGRVHFLTLTIGKLNEYMSEGIKLADLSNNFQQAIRVARFIRIRYIWIDSLCIVQGEGSDFETEGDLMHKVYRYSYCNIAAADSEDCRGGLFRDRDPGRIVPATFKANDSSSLFGQTTWRILPRDLWGTELLQTKVYTRGWVFQGTSVSSKLRRTRGLLISLN
jgi:Heterokaryon incompatibility protein (HET)